MDMNDKDGLPKPDPEDEAMRAQFLEEMRRRREEQEKQEAIEKKSKDLNTNKPLYRRSSEGPGGIIGLLQKLGIEDENMANVVMIGVIILALIATVWVLRGAFGGGSHPSSPPVIPIQGNASQTPAP